MLYNIITKKVYIGHTCCLFVTGVNKRGNDNCQSYFCTQNFVKKTIKGVQHDIYHNAYSNSIFIHDTVGTYTIQKAHQWK